MINELIEKIAPYLDQYKIKFTEGNEMIAINNSFYFDLRNYESLNETDSHIDIIAKGYKIVLFKNVDLFYSVTY
jgi:hypothetical protein